MPLRQSEQLERAVQGLEGGLKFLGEGIAAREIVKNNGAVGHQLGELFVHLESVHETAALGIMITEELEGVHIGGITAQDSLHEFNLGIKVALFGAVNLFPAVVFSRHTTALIFSDRGEQVKPSGDINKGGVRTWFPLRLEAE